MPRIFLDGQILQSPRSPEPVEVARPRVWDERLAAVLPSSSRLMSLYADATWAEGPVWVRAGSYLLFSDVPRNVIHKWTEAGGPAVQPPSRRGFGTRLIERGLSAELRSEVELEFRPTGLNCRILAKLPRISE